MKHRREWRAPRRRVCEHDYGIGDADLGMVQSSVFPLHLESELDSQSSLKEADEVGGTFATR
jgi:hypothetical protein